MRTKSSRVLLIEDNPDDAKLIKLLTPALPMSKGRPTGALTIGAQRPESPDIRIAGIKRIAPSTTFKFATLPSLTAEQSRGILIRAVSGQER